MIIQFSLIEVYTKPEVKEVTEEEVSCHLITFMRDIRLQEDTRSILNTLDTIQNNIEKLCPFGSMLKIFFKNQSHPDSWFCTNRDEVETGSVKLKNFMTYFEEATREETPIMIKDIFTMEYQKERPCFLKVQDKIVTN